jgi:hypothetical protein
MRKLLRYMLLLMLTIPAFASTKVPARLPFISDDCNRALVRGRQRQLPIFVEISAPW